MAIKNRDAFLDNLAANLGRPRRTEGVKRPKWNYNPQAEVLKGYTQDELVNVLEKQCDAIHTDFKKTTVKNFKEVLKETIDHYGKSIIAANDYRNEEFGINDLFAELHESNDYEFHVWDPKRGKENQVIAERADIGITFSDITLAESATVTLLTDKNNGRSISLLPKTYIAIIPKSTVVPRMTQATQKIHEAHQEGQDVSSCVSFISGPSNSADIEMNLIVGVHGPTKATYILVDDM
ncbi:MAG TPA: lactate utilization protein C [Candidatus Avamphibacillus sp.]|nr:lactate utilization protein C [Candidatus Avamphibacillus sp.]